LALWQLILNPSYFGCAICADVSVLKINRKTILTDPVSTTGAEVEVENGFQICPFKGYPVFVSPYALLGFSAGYVREASPFVGHTDAAPFFAASITIEAESELRFR
jgi:hypothetical protein